MKPMPCILLLLGVAACACLADGPSTRPAVWMSPPASGNGVSFRQLFEHPEQWAQTRALVDVLFYTDLNLTKQFTDDELRAWFTLMRQWDLKLALEVGAVKPWGVTGEKTFAVERPMWERIIRLGGRIYAIAMDEPLLCCREQIHKPDDHALDQTAAYIALVRRQFPDILIGDIETYPSISLKDQIGWIESLQKRLAQANVRGLDFYRLDVNWANFVVQNKGSWREVRDLERYCRQRKLPFGLIYWASEYPGLQKRGLADDSTWYVAIMQQGYDYAMVDGAPDQYVIESWVGAPARCLPETGDFTFTRSVKDFATRFVRPPRPEH